MLRIFKLRR